MARIAVFDTDYSSIRTISEALKGEGHEVVTNIIPVIVHDQMVMKPVTDPISLITRTLSFHVVDGEAVRRVPDLFIIDFLNLDGENIMDMLKQIRSTQNAPVIALSHKAPGIDRRRLLEFYGTHYIPKPFNVWDVVERTEAFLGITC